MNTWALLKNGRIVNTVTTELSIRYMRERYPEFEVRDIYTLPKAVQEDFQYWNEQP